MNFMLCDLLVKAKYILPLDDGLTVIKDGFVAASGSEIIALGTADEIKNYQAEEIIDAGNAIVMPGLINCHTHAAMAYFRGLADDLPFDVWLNERIWPAEAKYVNEKFVAKSGELACLEMIKSGTTCFNDMYFFGQDIMAKTAARAGLKALLGIDLKNPDMSINCAVRLAGEYKGNEYIEITLAPHSVYACSADTLRKAKEAAEANNFRLHIHVSESEKEIADCRKIHSKTPVEYLDELGLLSDKLVAAHSIHLSDGDLKIYQERGVKAVHCPVSNMKLASGIAPLAKLLKSGITVGLGTDGAASNNTMDMFADMRVCALLHKATNFNPAIINARQLVRMATINGAKALGREKEIGSLEVGKKADIISLNLDKPHLAPVYDPYSHLVYCANGADVDNVIINGKAVMRNREVKTLDEEKILAEANKFKM